MTGGKYSEPGIHTEQNDRTRGEKFVALRAQPNLICARQELLRLSVGHLGDQADGVALSACVRWRISFARLWLASNPASKCPS